MNLFMTTGPFYSLHTGWAIIIRALHCDLLWSVVLHFMAYCRYKCREGVKLCRFMLSLYSLIGTYMCIFHWQAVGGRVNLCWVLGGCSIESLWTPALLFYDVRPIIFIRTEKDTIIEKRGYSKFWAGSGDHGDCWIKNFWKICTATSSVISKTTSYGQSVVNIMCDLSVSATFF
jgi:hypothetical protein